MKKICKISGIVLALILIILCVFTTVSAEEKIIAQGKSGDIDWVIYDDGLMVFSGSGDFEQTIYGGFVDDKNGDDYFTPHIIPNWLDYENKIVKIKVQVQNCRNFDSLFAAGIYPNLVEVDFTGSDTSKIHSFECMFINKRNLKTVIMNDLDTSNLCSILGMFCGCTSLENVYFRGWDTDNVTDASDAFHGCKSLKTTDEIERLSFQNLRITMNMFRYSNIKKLDLSSWDMKNVADAGYMFEWCENLEELNTTGWNLENLYYADRMFGCCTSLKYIDGSKWNMRNLENAFYMFGWCYNLTGKIQICSEPEEYEGMFYTTSIYADTPLIIYYGGDCSREYGQKLVETNQGCSNYLYLYDDPRLNCVLNKHRIVTLPDKEPTYTETGLGEGRKCADCGTIMKSQRIIPKLTVDRIKGFKVKKVKVAKSSEITLTWKKLNERAKYEIYQKSGSKWKKIKTTGKTSYTVKKLKDGKKYQFRVRAVIDGAKGDYSKTLKVETIPATTSKLTLKAGKKALTASWKSVSDISGYEVQYSTSKKFTKKTTKIINAKKSSKKTTIKKLKKGKKYYVRVRACKTVNGKKVYSNWSTVKNVKVK